MKKTLSLVFSLLLVLGIFNVTAFATESEVSSNETKTIIVDVNDAMVAAAANVSSTKSLTKDMASSALTGTIYSIGQYVDFSSVIPAGKQIVSITMYCPTSVRVTQSTYTAINNFKISSMAGDATIPFVQTNTPTLKCKSTTLAGKPANVKWFVQIEGRILSNQTGFDGFTVFGGSKMIVEYK